MAAAALPCYQRLPWDSDHFGMAVGRIAGDVGDNATLARLLAQAKADGARLVYFLHTRPFMIDEKLLGGYGGRRVAGYVRFALSLPAKTAAASPEAVVLEPYAGPSDDPRLLELGVGAGWLSRFRQDDRLPPGKCDQLYQVWTRRSLAGELADETLVAWRDEAPIGLITYDSQSGRGEIGLVAIAQGARGGGVGRALLALAHRRMSDQGMHRAEVVTQSENQGACRLYRWAGYQAMVEGAYYHFMLATEEDAWTSR